MIPNPIRTVLSSIDKHRVRALLMGGQACVLYGAAEFSRDTDFAILASPANLMRLRAALDDLQARVIAVPPLEPEYLRRGHAVHFRSGHPSAPGLPIDVMTRMRGVDPFARLWSRRTTLELPGGTPCQLMALPDPIAAYRRIAAVTDDREAPARAGRVEDDAIITAGARRDAAEGQTARAEGRRSLSAQSRLIAMVRMSS